MRHIYILCGVVWENPEICNYRLISKPTYSLGQLVRVNTPDDLEAPLIPPVEDTDEDNDYLDQDDEFEDEDEDFDFDEDEFMEGDDE